MASAEENPRLPPFSTNWQDSCMDGTRRAARNSSRPACQCGTLLKQCESEWGNGEVPMVKAVEDTRQAEVVVHHHGLDWRRSMSNNVASALIVYTALQIFSTVHAMAKGFSSILPYVALVVLVAAIIPACRWFERRWINLSDEQAADESLRPAYRRDQVMLWLLAIGLPLALTAFFKMLFAAVG